MTERIEIDAPDIGHTCSWWTIVKWCVEDGDFVTVAQTIAVLENDEMTCELESFDSGVIRNLGATGKRIEVGGRIAEIHLNKEECEARMNQDFPVTFMLSGAELLMLDRYRGEQSRDIVARKLIVESLKQIGEQVVGYEASRSRSSFLNPES